MLRHLDWGDVPSWLALIPVIGPTLVILGFWQRGKLAGAYTSIRQRWFERAPTSTHVPSQVSWLIKPLEGDVAVIQNCGAVLAENVTVRLPWARSEFWPTWNHIAVGEEVQMRVHRSMQNFAERHDPMEIVWTDSGSARCSFHYLEKRRQARRGDDKR